MVNRLSMWTIYDRPADYPDSFVARRWEAVDGEAVSTNVIMRSDSLEWLREQMMDMGLVCLSRNDSDEPQVVETWI